MQNKTFHGILLDNLLNFGPNTPKIIDTHRELIWELMKDGIKRGVVRPLHRTIFNVDKCEDAFRYMASGKHTGKVIICIREEEKPGKASIDLRIPALPRTVFLHNKSYIITGGLGGFGLELANWMYEREARNLVLTSRTGVRNLYQRTRLDFLKSRGVNIKIFTDDTTEESGAQRLVEEAESLGPLGGVFHLAMVISDGLFDNQTMETFQKVVTPKANTCVYLDNITRKKCPEMDYFVVFSSVSCGFGNPGQSNYGFGNSVMERICEQRRRDKLHGFAIQWGAIGDVGYIIDNIRGNDISVCGSIPQRIPSCLSSLDRLLQSNYSVCSNLIKADSKFEATCGKTSLIKTVAHILGVKDVDKLDMNTTLGELGMDSLMGVEVKQAIERDYEVVLSMQDIRKLNIQKILEIGSGKTKQSSTENKEETDKQNKSSYDEQLMPDAALRYLNDILNGDPIIFLPQIDGTFDEMAVIAQKLNRPAIGLNWNKDCRNLKTVPEVASHFIAVIEAQMPNLKNSYDLVGYSFGGIIAIEMGIQLQQRKVGKLLKYRHLILLDSSPQQFKMFTDEAIEKYNIQDKFDDGAFVETILMFLQEKVPIDYAKIKELLLSMDNTTKRFEFVQELFKQMLKVDIQVETLEFLIQTHYNKMLMMNLYECGQKALQGDLMLIRASKYLINSENLVRKDYWLGEVRIVPLDLFGKLTLFIFAGHHWTMSSAHTRWRP